MKHAALSWPIATTLVASLLGAPALAAEEPPAATILEVSGPVSWKAPGQADFTAARGGEALFAGAVVRTGARGKARLRWSNGGDFRLMPLSEIKVADRDAVETTSGQIWSQFTEKLLRPFFFRSPSATAVVRGTTLAFGVDAEGATRVVVTEGKVEVSGREGRTIFVTGGQAVRATPQGRLGDLEPASQQEQQAPFEAGAAEAAPAPEAAPAERPRESGPRNWARLDDWTRRGLDWIDRHRASERLPLLRQEMTVRSRPETPAAGTTGEHPQAQAPEDRTGVSAGATPAGAATAPKAETPAVPAERPGDAWPQTPAAGGGSQPAQQAGDAWPQTPPSQPAAPVTERPGDPWPSKGNGAPECVNRPEDGTGQHTDLPECGQDQPQQTAPSNGRGKP